MNRFMDDGFWDDVRIRPSNTVKPVSDEPVSYIEPYTGKQKKGLVAKRASQDSTPFIKLYKGTTVLRASLSATANRVFDLVLYQLEGNKDTTFIKISTDSLDDFVTAVKKLNPKFKMDRSTMSRGIKELMERNIIRKIRVNEYQINPELFFNGDRVKTLQKERKGGRL